MRHIRLFEDYTGSGEFPIRELNYPLGFLSGGYVIETKRISELLVEDKGGYLRGLEEAALRLAKAGVQPLYDGVQSPEAIRNVLNFPDYYGSLKDLGSSDLGSVGKLKLSRFFVEFNPSIPGLAFGSGLAFSRDKSDYTPEQIAQSNAVQEALSPDGWTTRPEMGYVAALKWAQMRLAGQMSKSLGEYLLNTQSRV